MKVSRRVRMLLAGVLGAALVAAGVWWAAGAPFAPDTAPAWQTIEHDGVHVVIPGDWEQADMDDCEFRFERWAPRDADPCGDGEGVAFYGSATFDPRHGPGIRRGAELDRDAAAWAGYTYAGEYAVYGSTQQRATLEKILTSARPKQD